MPTVDDLNAQLERCYAQGWAQLNEYLSAAAVPGLSRPFLIRVMADYDSARCPVMVVGQQTGWWPWEKGTPLDSVQQLTQFYADFDLGKKHNKRSPFWRAAYKINSRFNPTTPKRAFIWTNLVRLSQPAGKQLPGKQGDRPPPDLEDFVAAYRWLNEEIRITRPKVIVFFTGPAYDYRLDAQFPGLRREAVVPGLDFLRHDELTGVALRTYHPKYLTLARRLRDLDLIVEYAEQQLVT
jgi:hypothetical protein